MPIGLKVPHPLIANMIPFVHISNLFKWKYVHNDIYNKLKIVMIRNCKIIGVTAECVTRGLKVPRPLIVNMIPFKWKYLHYDI